MAVWLQIFYAILGGLLIPTAVWAIFRLHTDAIELAKVKVRLTEIETRCVEHRAGSARLLRTVTRIDKIVVAMAVKMELMKEGGTEFGEDEDELMIGGEDEEE